MAKAFGDGKPLTGLLPLELASGTQSICVPFYRSNEGPGFTRKHVVTPTRKEKEVKDHGTVK